jgi:hypothetical protein
MKRCFYQAGSYDESTVRGVQYSTVHYSTYVLFLIMRV